MAATPSRTRKPGGRGSHPSPRLRMASCPAAATIGERITHRRSRNTFLFSITPDFTATYVDAPRRRGGRGGPPSRSARFQRGFLCPAKLRRTRRPLRQSEGVRLKRATTSVGQRLREHRFLTGPACLSASGRCKNRAYFYAR